MSEGRKKERKAMAPNLECRMYESKYPAGGMAVMIQVKTIAATGAYVSLLEYNNIMGKILFLELSRRRIRSVSSLIKVGRIEPMRVLRVDKEKGRIDLSKRRVSEEDIQSCKERYNKSKLVHSIMRHVAETSNIDLEELYVQIGWPLYRKYGHAFEAFKIVATDPDSVLSTLPRKIKQVGPDGRKVTKVVPAVSEEVKDSLVKNIRRRMNPQPQPHPLKIRADIEMKCFQFDGVLHIKEAMRKAEAAGNDDCPVKIKLVAPPLYVLTTQTLDKEQGILVLNNAIASCTESIERHKGELVVKEAPRAQIRTVQQGNMQNRMTTAGSMESEDDMPLRQSVRTTASTPVFKQPTQQTNPIPPPQPKTTSSPQTEPISTSSQVETQPDLNLPIQRESISPPQTEPEPEPITKETQTLDRGSDTILDIRPLASFRPISPPSTQPISSPPPSPHHTEPEITTESILEDDIVITSKIASEVIQDVESEPTSPDSHSTQTIHSSPTNSLPSDTINQQATLNQTQPNTETQTQPSANLYQIHPILVNRTQTIPLYRGPNCSLPLPNHHIFPTFERFMNQRYEQLEIEQQIERDRALSVHKLLAMEDYYAEWYNVNEWFESHKQQQLRLTRRLLAAPAWRMAPPPPAFWEPEPAPVVPETPPPTSSSDLIAQSSASAQSSHSNRIEFPMDVLDRLVEDNREFKQFMVSSSKKQEELADMLKLLLEKVSKP